MEEIENNKTQSLEGPMLEYLKGACIRLEPVGSRVTCVPAPTGTDEDWLALTTPEKFRDLELVLMIDFGCDFGGSRIHAGGCEMGDPNSFQSYTYGDVNIIATASQVFFDKFMEATAEAKRMNLLEKADRIALFQKILYGIDVNALCPSPFSPEVEKLCAEFKGFAGFTDGPSGDYQ